MEELKTKIIQVIKESGVIENYIKKGVLSRTAVVEVAFSSIAQGDAIIIKHCLTHTPDYSFVNELQNELASLFDGELVLIGHSVQSAPINRIEFLFSRCEPVQYDFSKTQEYLQGHCPPDVLSHYCSESLCDLWKVRSEVPDFFEDADRIFSGIAATLNLCKEVFEGIKINEDSEATK